MTELLINKQIFIIIPAAHLLSAFYPAEQIAPAFRCTGTAGFLPLEMAGQILLLYSQMKVAGSDPGIHPLDGRRVLGQCGLAHHGVEMKSRMIHHHAPWLRIGGGGGQAKQLQCLDIVPSSLRYQRCAEIFMEEQFLPWLQ